MIFAGIVFFIFSPTLVSFFNSTEEVVQAGVSFFRIISPFLVFMGFYIPLSGVFFGSGDTKPPMIITFITNLCFQIPMMILLSQIFEMKGAFLAYGLPMVVGSCLMFVWFRRGKWKEKKVE